MVTALIIFRRLYDIVLNKAHAVGRDFAIIIIHYIAEKCTHNFHQL